MKRTALLGIITLTVSLLPGTVAAQTDPTYVFEGSGWGHGVGMSQYGARAMAESGWTDDQILGTYYDGVTVEPIEQVLGTSHWLRSDEAPLWIGLAQNLTSLEFHLDTGSAGLCQANDGEGACPTQTATIGQNWEFRALGGGACQFFLEGEAVGSPGTCRAFIEWVDQPATRVHLVGHGEYARGTIKMRPVGEGFHVVLETGIDDYIYGLGEMPSHWHPEALQAQAIAARTYGIRQALKWGPETSFSAARKSQCWCQLYDTTADQSYVGWLKENEPGDIPWKDAVDATSGQIVTHPQAPDSTVIIAYYSSSSGGHTDNNVDGFGHSAPLPYLKGISDPWSVDPLSQNPHASWSKGVKASRIAEAVGLDTVTGMSITSRNDSGTVAEVAIAGTVGGSNITVTRSGRSLKRALGLRSTTFGVVPPSGAVTPSPGGGLCEDPAPPDAGFSDVLLNSVHKADIDCMALLGVIPGLTSSTFEPTRLIPRSDMALFMKSAAEWMGIVLPAPIGQGFTDIDHLARVERDAINQLAMVGLTKGTGLNTYSPGRSIDRWQMAIFLVRLHVLAGFDPPPGSGVFTDLGNHVGETVTSINQLYALGVTKGCAVDPARYCPDTPVTREQMSSFLARLIRLDT